MRRKIYESPLLTIDDVENLSVICVSTGEIESVEYENWY